MTIDDKLPNPDDFNIVNKSNSAKIPDKDKNEKEIDEKIQAVKKETITPSTPTITPRNLRSSSPTGESDTPRGSSTQLHFDPSPRSSISSSSRSNSPTFESDSSRPSTPSTPSSRPMLRSSTDSNRPSSTPARQTHLAPPSPSSPATRPRSVSLGTPKSVDPIVLRLTNLPDSEIAAIFTRTYHMSPEARANLNRAVKEGMAQEAAIKGLEAKIKTLEITVPNESNQVAHSAELGRLKEELTKLKDEQFVVLFRGTKEEKILAMVTNGAAGNEPADPSAVPPTEMEAKAQVGESKSFPEFTKNPQIAEGFAKRGCFGVFKIKTKYLAEGSVSEEGFICKMNTPVELLLWKEGGKGEPGKSGDTRSDRLSGFVPSPKTQPPR